MSRVDIEVVTAPSCHLCEDAHRILLEVGMEFPVRIREIAWDSPEGVRRRIQGAALFPPAIFINGRFFSYGRLSRGRLRKALEALLT
jgi:hypothetical protein